MTVFELWDIEGSNLVGAYETEAEALAVVRRAILAHGERYADGLALLMDDDGDEMVAVAAGAALASCAVADDAAAVPAATVS